MFCLFFISPSSVYGIAIKLAGQGKSPAKGYGLSQAPSVFCGQSLKRSTARPPPADPRVQRRRIAHQRRNHQSGLIQPRSYPAIPFPIPAAFPHIKWQGIFLWLQISFVILKHPVHFGTFNLPLLFTNITLSCHNIVFFFLKKKIMI